MNNVLVTGGCGYVGHVLVSRLLGRGHKVTVYDTIWFQNRLPNHVNLCVVKGDIRDTEKLASLFWRQDTIIHLACIANDPSVELDADLTKQINLDCFEPMVIAAKNSGAVKRFIYCSTSSVYGTSNQPEVTEESPCVPITLYNTYKAHCEPLLFKHASEDFTCIILRPATVAGYSPRQRLDLCVNILTNHAVNKGKITVFGGSQMRPNIHIEDLVDAYELLLTAPPHKVHKQIFNCTCHFDTISNWALLVKNTVEKLLPRQKIEIITTPSDDPRSYKINADKIFHVLGYKPKRTIELAVEDLVRAFSNHLLPNSLEDPIYFDVETMKKMGVGTTPRVDPGYVTPAGAVL
jgi:nucleoside-diphosphate-sugar epimerase